MNIPPWFWGLVAFAIGVYILIAFDPFGRFQ